MASPLETHVANSNICPLGHGFGRSGQGGPLSHGMKINASGKLYNVVAYGVDHETSRVSMEEVARVAEEFRPKIIIAGWSAYPRQLDFAAFREVADSVGALLLVDMAHF